MKSLFHNTKRLKEEHKLECVGLDDNSHNPEKGWEIRKETQNVKILDPEGLQPISEDKLRIVCTSDTHEKLNTMISRRMIPPGDVLIHTGDLTHEGYLHALREFDNELGLLRHRVKLVIAGNHDHCLDRSMIQRYKDEDYIPYLGMVKSDVQGYVQRQTRLDLKATDVKSILRNCVYLEDSMVGVCGVKIYGTPWMEKYTKCVAFSVNRGEALLKKWNSIPDNVDILMTHTPPLGYGDKTHSGHHVGCVDLLNTIQRRVQPQYHIYGHIHEGYGIRSDGTTTFINCAACSRHYRPDNLPVVFDYPIPKRYRKSDQNWVKIIKEIGPPPIQV
ncbi:hypothetical protein LOTGIDRAFT_121596 [Lottia gigantea]|uniref:Calcineurin-like phosphoesterase domain-containing protein n=1 Tax=Lottia gigantea TaxID=225164 RepID=V3ZKR4_LOTGI|nr:hypothetical protein LOTGIDRAFT_121596 [Lottia gigantea]ESO91938.1 hypothetical protein LOTGIDRAFT_121596 [Lottia gigantea]